MTYVTGATIHDKNANVDVVTDAVMVGDMTLGG